MGGAHPTRAFTGIRFTNSEELMRNWLLSLPCVVRGDITVDVRGPHPIIIKGVAATIIRVKDDAIYFIIQHVD